MAQSSLTIGRVTADLELKMSQNKNPYVRFNLAEDVGFGSTKTTQFPQIWARGVAAERLISGKDKKGSLIWVSGPIVLEEYAKKDGVPDMRLKITLEGWGFVPGGRPGGSGKRKEKSKKMRRSILVVPRGHESDGPAVEQVLLRHVNCRISAYLKAVYPEATWEWECDAPVDIACNGGTGRIRLYGVSEFNFAEVRIDNFARIECSLLKSVPLDGTERPAKQAVHPEMWYGVFGKSVLEECVSELNSLGYDGMTIAENGSIYALGREVKPELFKHLPGRNNWHELVRIFEKDGLAASIADEGILVSW